MDVSVETNYVAKTTIDGEKIHMELDSDGDLKLYDEDWEIVGKLQSSHIRPVMEFMVEIKEKKRGGVR